LEGLAIEDVGFRGHCVYKEMPVILVNKVVDPKRIIRKKWRAKEEETHKGSLTQKIEDVGIFYDHSVNFPAIFGGHLVYFPRFGMLYQKNLAALLTNR
jgi:hypothetical protein